MRGILVRDDDGPAEGAEPGASRVRSWRRPGAAGLLLAAIVLLWAWITLPWITGDRLLVFRDVMYTHRHFKAFGAEELAAGRIPAFNPTWGSGQPFRGNPNALPFYPGNLLYLALPFESAFHLHYALHWLLALFGMRALARRLGQSAEGALMAGVAWAGSGYVLTMLSFYNILAVLAWAPVVLAGLARGGRRGLAFGGLACGMMLLGGEPVSAALVGLPMALVAVERHGLRRGAAALATVGGIGVAVALPQVVASARAMAFSFRTVHGLEAVEVGWQSLHPLRLLELVLALPWGWPADYARFGFWSKRVTPDIPYVLTIHLGVVAFALALAAARRRWRWSALAALALFGAWAGGFAPELLAAVTRGTFRYPQKLALVATLAGALLAGWGLDAALGRARVARAFAVGAGALAATALLFWFGFERVVALFRDHLAEGGKEILARTHAGGWMVGFAVAALLVALAAWALARRQAALVVALELAGLAQLAPVVVTDDATFYRARPPLLASVTEPRAVVPVPAHEPDWEPRLPYPLEVVNPAGQARVGWFQLEAPFGVPWGLSYPVAPDLEGLTTPLHVLVTRNLQLLPWSARARWLPRLGVGWVVRFAGDPAAGIAAELPGLERAARAAQFGVDYELWRVPGPAPALAWPESLVIAPTPLHGLAAVADGRVPRATAVVSRAVAHVAGAAPTLVERTPDRWVFDVESGGGLAVLQTVYHPLWRARTADGRRLATQPVDVALLGIEVPAGRQRVVVDVASWPEATAGALALVAALAALAVALRSRPS